MGLRVIYLSPQGIGVGDVQLVISHMLLRHRFNESGHHGREPCTMTMRL